MSHATDSPQMRLETILGQVVTAVEIQDDWDESDRAKVNVVVGQAGVAANSGVRSANTIRVTQATNDTFAYFAEASFTPAASSHTAGDVNGGAQEFALGMPAGSTILIHTVSIRIDGANPESTGWFLYLFDVTPPSALADLGDFLLAAGDRASFLGRINLGTALDLGSTQFLQTHSVNAQFKLHSAGTSLFGYLVNDTTVTPAAVAHVVRIHGKAI